MTSIELEKLNEEISYEDGKIYWEHCKGYTSNLIKNLYNNGWQTVKSGAIHILKDAKGMEVTTGYSWEGLLKNAAIAMR